MIFALNLEGTITERRLAIALLATSLVYTCIGCTPDGNGGGSNGEDGNNGDTARSLASPDGTVTESEPNDQEGNAVELNKTIEGTLDGSADAGDYDTFTAELDAGTFYRIDIESVTGDLEAENGSNLIITVTPPDQARRIQYLYGPFANGRDFFAHASGEYDIQLTNKGTVLEGSRTDITGDYELTFVELTPAVTNAQMPATVEGSWQNRQVDVRKVTVDEPKALVAESFAMRLSADCQQVFEGVDTTLAVWDATNESLVGINDNRPGATAVGCDSKVSFQAEPATDYWVIMDPTTVKFDQWQTAPSQLDYRFDIGEEGTISGPGTGNGDTGTMTGDGGPTTGSGGFEDAG